MTIVTNGPTLNDGVNNHHSISRTVEVGEQLVLIAKFTRDVVLETSTTVANDLNGVARHLGLSKLSIINKIRVCHDHYPAKTVCGISESVR